MQETSVPPDPGFVVDWQLFDDSGELIDLSTAETEIVLPDEPYVRGAPARQ
jgi:hypothetical protein